MLNRLKALTPLLALACLLEPAGAAAAGVGVTPGSLEIKAYPLMPAGAAIVVTNPSTGEARYQVYAEGEAGDWLVITPAEFTLGPGSSRPVEIIADPPLGARGDYELAVCAVALSPATGLEVGCGVKIPLRISVGLAPPPGRVAGLLTGPCLKWLVTGIAAAAVTVPLALRRRRRHAL